MKNTLIELPPPLGELAGESTEVSDATSVEEVAVSGHIKDERIIKRLLLPGQQFGLYKILRFVAAGGMGEVYAAERLMPDGRRLGPVALKVIAPEYMDDWAIAERFKREAQISRAIRSPYVTRVYEFGKTAEGHAFLSMELLNGEELFDRMYTQPMTHERSVEVIMEVLAGLRAVHDAGFVHRDIKPENVYFTRKDGEEHVKLLDFGISKVKDQRSDPFLSVVGKIYGTPEYISPEQGLNPDVDERADLYSVGVILYELLAGKLPFEGDTAYAIILAHQNQTPPEIPEIDARLHKIVRKAMEKRPVDRYQTAFEFQEDLRKWLDHQRHDFMQDSRPQRTHVGFPLTQAPEPVGLSEASETAPPVQIFSRTRRRRHDPTPHHPVARPPKTEDPPVTAVKKPVVLNEQPIIDPRDEKAQGSVAASIVTGVFILIVLGVVIYMTVLT